VVGQAEGNSMPDFNSEEKQRIQRANQIFLRLRKELHDRGAQFAERDVREAAQSARWLREVIEQHPADWEQVYEDTLVEADLTENDLAYLRGEVERAGGFLPFTRRNLRRLEQTSGSVARTTRQDFLCRVAASIIAGGVMTGNSFYFGFWIGMSRKAGCW
jgi:hypothetical protein